MTQVKQRPDPVYGKERVRIQNVAPCWEGKIGTVLRWLHDDWYLVECEGRELVLDLSRSEFVKI